MGDEQKLFGTDGVRGRANRWPMTPEIALALGRAVGKIFRRHSGKHRVVIGKDTRLSGYVFENALISGLCSMGIDTLMVGPLPTPGVAFITRTYRADAGIVISASHNPYCDNGIKFFSGEGYKLPDSWESEVEALVRSNDFADSYPLDSDMGKNMKLADADGRYIEFVKGTLPKKMMFRKLTVALDCANGAAFRVAPMIFRELDAKVYAIGVTPDGLNINENCGSLHPEAVVNQVLQHRADVGIALDGDADRVIMVDENGVIIDGDVILAICAAYMKEWGILRNNKIVATVMSNFGLIKAMTDRSIGVVTSKVGDRYVIQDMLEHNANLGGEQSGHLIFGDHNTTGDGLVSALQVLRIMTETGKSLSQLARIMDRCPQALINVRVNTKPPIESLLRLQQAVSTVEQQLGAAGRVLVRYSGTENVCRVMVEGPKQLTVDSMARVIADAVKQEIGA